MSAANDIFIMTPPDVLGSHDARPYEFTICYDTNLTMSVRRQHRVESLDCCDRRRVSGPGCEHSFG
jgi:hypothetical protein